MREHKLILSRLLSTVRLGVRSDGCVLSVAKNEARGIPHFVAEVAIRHDFVDIQVDIARLLVSLVG